LSTKQHILIKFVKQVDPQGGVWFADGHGLARMPRTGPLRLGSLGARAA
jgi:hypothetical protein